MEKNDKMRLLLSIFAIIFLSVFTIQDSKAGAETVSTILESDTSGQTGTGLVYFFDLRERETFVQLTYPDRTLAVDCCGFGSEFEQISTGLNATAHVQIYDVSNNCNENNFFDVYTPADTHVYNMKDIQTNDGNPSGVVLPDGAYGMVVISMFRASGEDVE